MLDEDSVATKAEVSNNGPANYESGREYLFDGVSLPFCPWKL